MENILARRSIRSYTAQMVPDEIISELLKAAMSAPSSGNSQPWHFIVIRDREVLDKIPTFHPYAEALKQASVAIMVCGDINLDKYGGRWMLDCSAASQNILLAVQAKGLGAVWLGLYPDEERIKPTRQLLGIPDHVIPLCIIPVGYPAEQKKPSQRFKPERIHQDRW